MRIGHAGEVITDLKAVIVALVAGGTLDSGFTVEENDLAVYVCPCIVLKIRVALPQLLSAGFDWVGYNVEIFVTDQLKNHSKDYLTCLDFVADQTKILLQNLEKNMKVGSSSFDSGIYGEYEAVRSTTLIEVN